MNSNYTTLLLLFSFFAVILSAFGSYDVINQTKTDVAKTEYLKSIASGCLPASAWAELTIGGVRTRINNGGDMWWDHSQENIYEVPKGSGRQAMFDQALWIGGTDGNGQLRIAAQKYRYNGNDFWPGPLTNDGNATTDASVCPQYDFISVLYRQDVINFLTW
jgi:hypothetical protein